MIEDMEEEDDLAVSNPEVEVLAEESPGLPKEALDLLIPTGEVIMTFMGVLGLKVEEGTKSGGG